MTRIPLLPGALRALLARREQLLVEDERRAVQAALNSATPEERAELERPLERRPPRRAA